VVHTETIHSVPRCSSECGWYRDREWFRDREPHGHCSETDWSVVPGVSPCEFISRNHHQALFDPRREDAGKCPCCGKPLDPDNQ
jgi:hypothetical protein